jgi:hypothetical protein
MKCLFDNCLPKKLSKTIQYLEGEDGIKVFHLQNKFSPDTPDIGWINSLSKEGNWFVITRDNQIKKKPHERKAWKEAGLPVVFLAKNWMHFDFWDIAWRFIRYWPSIKDIIERSRVSYTLTINGKLNSADG